MKVEVRAKVNAKEEVTPMGKHDKRKEKRHSRIPEEFAIALSASVLTELIKALVRWLMKQ